VDLILAEDTRVTKRLLDKYEIKTPLKAYHAFNEHQATEKIIEELQSGKNIAWFLMPERREFQIRVFLLARACREANEELTVLPGPTAFVPALVGSGFPCDRFHFEGFLPHKKGRNTRWKFLNTIETTIVLYESPFRVLKCLEEIQTSLGADRNVCVVREISKLHEQFHFGTPASLLEYFDQHPEKGQGGNSHHHRCSLSPFAPYCLKGGLK
jgi:16S rRNA (cytidine1402-2'-O)-methyltransferase